jgi:excisionase family DNA binding protein
MSAGALRVKEVAKALQVSDWYVYERIRRGEIPVALDGRMKRIPRDWVEQRLGTTAEAGGATIDSAEGEALVKIERRLDEVAGEIASLRAAVVAFADARARQAKH